MKKHEHLSNFHRTLREICDPYLFKIPQYSYEDLIASEKLKSKLEKPISNNDYFLILDLYSLVSFEGEEHESVKPIWLTDTKSSLGRPSSFVDLAFLVSLWPPKEVANVFYSLLSFIEIYLREGKTMDQIEGKLKHICNQFYYEDTISLRTLNTSDTIPSILLWQGTMGFDVPSRYEFMRIRPYLTSHNKETHAYNDQLFCIFMNHKPMATKITNREWEVLMYSDIWLNNYSIQKRWTVESFISEEMEINKNQVHTAFKSLYKKADVHKREALYHWARKECYFEMAHKRCCA